MIDQKLNKLPQSDKNFINILNIIYQNKLDNQNNDIDIIVLPEESDDSLMYSIMNIKHLIYNILIKINMSNSRICMINNSINKSANNFTISHDRSVNYKYEKLIQIYENTFNQQLLDAKIHKLFQPYQINKSILNIIKNKLHIISKHSIRNKNIKEVWN